MRIHDCKEELHSLLLEDVREIGYSIISEIHASQEVGWRVTSCFRK